MDHDNPELEYCAFQLVAQIDKNESTIWTLQSVVPKPVSLIDT